MNAKELGDALARSDIPRELQAALGFASSFVATCPEHVWREFIGRKLITDPAAVPSCNIHRNTLAALEGPGVN